MHAVFNVFLNLQRLIRLTDIRSDQQFKEIVYNLSTIYYKKAVHTKLVNYDAIISYIINEAQTGSSEKKLPSC